MTRRSATALLLLCPVAFPQTTIAGTYKGKWTGQTANGDFFLTLEQTAGEWKAAIQFTIAGNDVPTTTRTLRVSGSAIETKYDFDLGGNKLQSHLQGEIKDGQLTGKYKTITIPDETAVDEGACDAKRQ